MSDSRLEDAWQRIAYQCWVVTSRTLGVQSVTIQPRRDAINQDRVIGDKWVINGNQWLFVAVCDGHFGPVTAEYTAKMLPTLIRRRLRSFIQKELHGVLDRTNIHQCEHMVTTMLKEEVEKFDDAIGAALQDICPNPSELTEAQARELIQKHKDIISRAFEGTTLAFALVNIDQRFMWAASVGDSTVALSTVGDDGKRHGRRLCDLHTFKDPREYYRATMAHTHHEQPLLDWENRILGWLSVPRAIGDFALKLPAPYLSHLFRYTSYGDRNDILKYAPKIITPPYIIAEPSVRFTDLEPVWNEKNKLVLFTDGVDNLVDGYIVFTPEKHSGADPVDVVSRLLSDEADPEVEQVLGHKIDPKWSRENNKAIDILGNLLGGTNVERLEMVMDEERLRDTGKGWPFHIDDTTIAIWGLGTVLNPSI